MEMSAERGDYAALKDYHRRLEDGPLDPDPAEIHDDGPLPNPRNCRHLLVVGGACLNCTTRMDDLERLLREMTESRDFWKACYEGGR